MTEGAAQNLGDAVDVLQRALDITKCVTIVGSLFQTVVVVATLVDLGFEMNRARKELPRMKEKLRNLQQSVVNSIIPVPHPNGTVKDLLMEDTFKVQEESLTILGKIEDHIMSSNLKQSLWATELKKIEYEMKRFESSVLGWYELEK